MDRHATWNTILLTKVIILDSVHDTRWGGGPSLFVKRFPLQDSNLGDMFERLEREEKLS